MGDKNDSPAVYKVLFVDDEAKVLDIARKSLSGPNYTLLTSAGSLEALETVSNRGPIAVVLSDNRMPAMTGTEFLEKIKSISPHTVRILTTAYLDPQVMEDMVNKGEVFRFLKKPLDLQQANQAILDGLKQYKKNVEESEKRSLLNKLSARHIKLRSRSEELSSKVSRLEKWVKILSLAIVLMVFSFAGYEVVVNYWKPEKPAGEPGTVNGWITRPDGTALDIRNNLMWMTRDFRGIEKRQPKNWTEAMEWADKMNKEKFAGHGDWRVPTIAEYGGTYDADRTRLAFDGKKDYPVGYPKAFEDGGGYGFWSREQAGMDKAKYYFFIGGYEKTESVEYDNPTMSVRLARSP
ncbi:MAG: response regulator [Nitrospinae bacterium]|nr:response regulator [Nitrospinota bacterium]